MTKEENPVLDMHAKLVATVEGLKAQGIKFENTPVLYKWSYEDLPEIEFSLLIKLKPDEEKGTLH